jgi:colanic acid biosynthesis glycosyl transferase WcaI
MTLRRDPAFAMTVPSKLQTYLACGRPVIAALDGEGARVLEESGAGLSCPADDPRALADAVLAFYRMPVSERKRMGDQGRVYFETEFERGILLQRLCRCIDDTVNENKQCAF